MIDTVEFMGQSSPSYITNGNSARFIKPIFVEVCKGDNGCEIGYGKNDWRINENAWHYDKQIDTDYCNDIQYLKQFKENCFDWIFSSHCLEHIKNWKESLTVWTNHIKSGGILFLYLPHHDNLYWRPENMPTKKHVNHFHPYEMESIFKELGYKNIFVSERDLAFSFGIFGEKK